MMNYRLAALSLFCILTIQSETRAENWVQPLPNDRYWWVDLDSNRRDQTNQVFKLHMGANPRGRYDAAMNYSRWVAVNCASNTLYDYNESSKTWTQSQSSADFVGALARLVCR